VQLYRRAFRAMGSPCDIQLFATSPRKAEEVIDAALEEIARLEAHYSCYREDSLVSEINRVAALGGALSLDPETASLIDYAATCHRESEGLFDITSGILRRAWCFRRGELPDRSHVQRLLDRVGWHRVDWSPPRLAFPVPGMEIDLGGVVKEYAVDRVTRRCREAGVCHGFVNLGGDVGIVGPRPEGEGWRIGIRHPRRCHALIETLSLRGGALATSGDYERCIVANGERFGHILDPRTGWPVRHLASVSVVADLCVVAGSASTIAVLRQEEGPSWLARLGLPHHWVDVNGRIGGRLWGSASLRQPTKST
jgi:thiamine biosynthesis lipoprotein